MALHTVYFCIGLPVPAARALLEARGLAYEEGERASTEGTGQVPPLIADDSQLTQAYLQALMIRQEEAASQRPAT
ncbi:hypothetical protein [Noviherbaspirillum malthae]|uniref:hypothetical protein n=1 Tax=Noviherbaspirillum malthae TaxID=1260987 RepID=UPI00188EF257|nr:hypothetical protein [Noviherbaspirillum malthae]